MSQPCPDCKAGYSPAGSAIRSAVAAIFSTTYRHPADAELKALAESLAGRLASGTLGHDGLDEWTATKKIGSLLGLEGNWSACKTCGGEGELENSQ